MGTSGKLLCQVETLVQSPTAPCHRTRKLFQYSKARIRMVLAKSKNAVGLGNSLMNDRFGKGKGADRKKVTTAGIHRINHATGETHVTNDRKEASWVKMRSVTEQAIRGRRDRYPNSRGDFVCV